MKTSKKIYSNINLKFKNFKRRIVRQKEEIVEGQKTKGKINL